MHEPEIVKYFFLIILSYALLFPRPTLGLNITGRAIFLYHGKIPFDEPGGGKGYTGLHDGNIQDLCIKYERRIPNTNVRIYASYLSYNSVKLKDMPYLYQFLPSTPVYGVNDYGAIPIENQFAMNDCFQNNIEYYEDNLNCTYIKQSMLKEKKSTDQFIKLGSWTDVVYNQKLKVSLFEAGVLPLGSRFWNGLGCSNWSDGTKSSKGRVGYSDYRLNYMSTIRAKCKNKYYWLCLGIQ